MTYVRTPAGTSEYDHITFHARTTRHLHAPHHGYSNYLSHSQYAATCVRQAALLAAGRSPGRRARDGRSIPTCEGHERRGASAAWPGTAACAGSRAARQSTRASRSRGPCRWGRRQGASAAWRGTGQRARAGARGARRARARRDRSAHPPRTAPVWRARPARAVHRRQADRRPEGRGARSARVSGFVRAARAHAIARETIASRSAPVHIAIARPNTPANASREEQATPRTHAGQGQGSSGASGGSAP